MLTKEICLDNKRTLDEIEDLTTRFVKWTMTWVAFSIILGFFGMVGLLFFFPVNPGIRDIMMMLVGALSAGLNNIIRYYFGNGKKKN